MKKQYGSSFYKVVKTLAQSSAEVVVPLVLDCFEINSVVDVGCGLGTWLSVFNKHGINDFCGIDGSWVNKQKLEISNSNFIDTDLTKPLKLGRRFDLVVSLEVIEHIPAKFEKVFLDNLTSLGNVILFSGAIPYQDGANHVNERWQSYWQNEFYARNYIAIDCLRRKIWHDTRVASCYTQNIFIYIKESEIRNHKFAQENIKDNHENIMDIVHPSKYVGKATLSDASLKYVLQITPSLIFSKLKQKLTDRIVSKL